MAWEKTHKITVKGVSKRQIWKVWEDVNQWHLWDADIEYAKLNSPFQLGNKFELKPKGGPKVKIELVEVDPENSFTDLTRFPLARMYGIHQMQETHDGIEVGHTVRSEGPLSFLWKKIVAEKVAAGIEEQAQKMIERAQSLRSNV
jgi:hypothetical protein